MTHHEYGLDDYTSSLFGPLEVDVVRDDPNETVIFVRGELARAAVPLLAGCLREVLDMGGAGTPRE